MGFLHMMHQDVFCLAIFRNTNTDESFGNLAILSGGYHVTKSGIYNVSETSRVTHRDVFCLSSRAKTHYV